MDVTGRRSGVVLVLVGGVVALLVGLSLALLYVVRAFSGSAALSLEAAAARAAAASGAEYAAARLAEDVSPCRSVDPAMRGDDWAFRDGPDVPLARALNPSYSHGEGWLDADADGAWDESEAAGEDLDGNRGFSAWSGRLRGGKGALPDRFFLRIESADGKIPLNAALPYAEDGIDNDGNGEVDDQADSAYARGGGIEVWLDIASPYRASLVRILDNLCAIRGVSTPNLGDFIFQRRPRGGYRDWEGVERALLSDASLPYTRDDLEKVRPFVDLGPYETMPGFSRCPADFGERPPPYVPISLRTASEPVLRAAWRNLSGTNPYRAAYGPATSNDFRGEDGGWSAACSRTGRPFSESPLQLYPDEADAVARETVAFRALGPFSWGDLRAHLVGKAHALFPQDFADLAAFPYFRRSWVAAKASLAWVAATVDPYPWGEHSYPLVYWATRGLDANPEMGGVQPVPALGVDAFGSAPPQGFTLAPSVSFDVASLGRSARSDATVAGRCRALERMELASQEDFEALWEEAAAARGSGTALAGRGITLIHDLTPGERFSCPDGLRDPPVVSLPRWTRRGFGEPADPVSGSCPENVLKPPYNGHDFRAGALTLASAPAPLGSAQACWGFPQDFIAEDRDLPNVAHREGLGLFDPGYYTGFDPATANPRRFPPGPPPQGGIPCNLDPLAVRPHLAGGSVPISIFPGGCLIWERYTPRRVGTQTFQHIQYRDFAFSCWVGPTASVIFPPSRGTFRLDVSRGYDGGDLAKPGARFALNISTRPSLLRWNATQWAFSDTASAPTPVPAPVFVPDAGQPAGSHHVHLTVRFRFDGGFEWVRPFSDGQTPPLPDRALETSYALYVDGVQRLAGSLPGYMGKTTTGSVEFSGVDDVRGWASAAPPPALFEEDRFRRTGTFHSPRYDLGSRATFRGARFEAVRPHGTADKVRVFAVGYDAAGAQTGEAELGWDQETDLAAAGFPPSVRSFRYRVEFDSTDAPAPMLEAPVFESVWFTFRRAVASPWLAWSAR